MTDKVLSPLRRRMIEDMTIRKLAPKTQQGYIRNVKAFAAFLGRSPRHCEQGGCPPLSAATDIERCGHAKDQQHREKAGTSRARCEGRWRLTSWA